MLALVVVLHFMSCCMMCVEFWRFVYRVDILVPDEFTNRTVACGLSDRRLDGFFWGYFPRYDPFPRGDLWYNVPVSLCLFFLGIYEVFILPNNPANRLPFLVSSVLGVYYLPIASFEHSLYVCFCILLLFISQRVLVSSWKLWAACQLFFTHMYFTLDDLYYGTLFFDGDEVASATISLPRRTSRYNDVRVVDGNSQRNSFRWRHMKRTECGSYDLSRLVGHTYVGDVVLPYPVSCDPATLLRFRDMCATDIKKWRCFVSGKYDLSIVDPSPLFHLYDVMPAFTRFGNPLSLQALIGAVIYSTLGTRILVLAPVGHHLTYVVVEELFNEITRFPVWLIESLQAFNLVGWHGVLIKTFVHGTLHLFPFPLRLVVHMVWNTVVTCIDFNCRPLLS